MKKVIILSGMFSMLSASGYSQTSADSSYLIKLNQQIDTYVMEKNLGALDTLYAADFVFSHGTGLVDNKTSWLKTVTNGKYLLRQHDSVKVELHPGLAILKGKMDSRRVNSNDGKTVTYHLRYIRVYALRNRHWEMISHSTTYELDEAN